MMVQHSELGRKREQQRESLERNFFSAIVMYKNIMTTMPEKEKERITIDLKTLVQ
jgi:ribosomal protein L17